MNNELCVDLDLNIDPLAPGISVYDLGRNPPGSKFEYNLLTWVESKFINPELIELIQSLGLIVKWRELFYTNPDSFTGIHVDDALDEKFAVANNDVAKMNFVFSGIDSKMIWYTPITIVNKLTYNRLNTTYYEYNLDQVNYLHEATVGFPSLVQAGIPHNIKNGSSGRFCLSLTLCHNDSDISPIGMKQALEIFKDYIK